MKKIVRAAIIIMALIAVNTLKCFAQATAIANVGANVMIPVTVIKNFDMNFGNAAVSGISGGSIILAPGGTRTLIGSGVTLPASTGTVAAAVFTVSGAPGYSYAITLPGNTVINGPAAATMMVNGFTSVPSGVGVLNSVGRQQLNVGATLVVAAAQASGSYTNAGAVPITVNYN